MSHVALHRAQQRSETKASVDPFAIRGDLHPPSATPSAHQRIAQDEAIGSATGWATNTYAGLGLFEGQTFLGFPYLAELAQRPEYRRIAETVATEMTRKWIRIQASGDEDKSEKVKKLDDAFDRLGIRDAFRRIAEQDAFFGRAHLYLDFDNSDQPGELTTSIGDGADDTSKSKIAKGSLKRVRAIEAVWCYPSNYNSTNPLAADWYSPAQWYVQGKPIHATRLLTFVGREVPDILKPTYSFGGLSMSQMVKPYIDNWLRTRQSVSDLIASFSVSGVKINKLAEAIEGNADALFRRVDFFTALRDNRGTMVVDTEEDFFNVSTPLGSLDKLQAQSQEHVCSVAGIPLVKYTGIAPSGLNASSDGEIRVWYDWTHAYQERFFTPNLRRVLAFVQLAEFGEIDPAIGFIYNPLWSLSEKDAADLRKVEADTDAVLIGAKALSVTESRTRIAHSEDTPYAGLDIDDLPKSTEADGVDVGVKKSTVILAAHDAGLLSEPAALKGLQGTGLFPGITDADVDAAEAAQLADPPAPEAGEGSAPPAIKGEGPEIFEKIDVDA